MSEISPGVYRHYKGNNYRVHDVALHTETEEPMVFYEALYDTGLPWRMFTRPLKEFAQEMELPDGSRVPRYVRLEETTAHAELNMHKLVRLLSLLQLTKEQPLTGYLAAGIKLHETATLAEHHYAAALSAYLVGQEVRRAGGKLDVNKVVIMTLIHDLGELFGGDISGPLNRKYPDLRDYKDKIAERAIDLIGGYLSESGRSEFRSLWEEFEFGDTDEAVVGRIMDQMDHQFFLEHYKYKFVGKGADYRPAFLEDHILKRTEGIKDPITRQVMNAFLIEFKENFFGNGFDGLSVLMEQS